MPYLKHDIKSAFAPQRLYGKAGEEVKIISGDGNVFLVEGKELLRFPVLGIDFSEQPNFSLPEFGRPAPADQDPVPVKRTKTKVQVAVKPPDKQQSLF